VVKIKFVKTVDGNLVNLSNIIKVKKFYCDNDRIESYNKTFFTIIENSSIKPESYTIEKTEGKTCKTVIEVLKSKIIEI